MSPNDSPRERRWRPSSDDRPRGPRLSLVIALVLACATMITLDKQGGDGSPIEPLRRVMGEALGPAEVAAAAVVRPVVAVPTWFRSQGALRADVDSLQQENSQLRAELRSADFNRNRLAAYNGLTAAAGDLGRALVPARVVGVGPSQSFSHTVTIDAGSRAGIRPDMTVLNADGLVGRVLRVTRSTATVLLIIDADSTVGGRIGSSMKAGFLDGRGTVGADGTLDLELIDGSVVPAADDTVVTWGSTGGAPYVAGVPIGRVTQVFSSIRESAQRAVIEPFVDFGALDVVGVVVPSGATSDRAVVEADGTLQ